MLFFFFLGLSAGLVIIFSSALNFRSCPVHVLQTSRKLKMEQTWIDFSRSTLSVWWGAFLWKGPRDGGDSVHVWGGTDSSWEGASSVCKPRVALKERWAYPWQCLPARSKHCNIGVKQLGTHSWTISSACRLFQSGLQKQNLDEELLQSNPQALLALFNAGVSPVVL